MKTNLLVLKGYVIWHPKTGLFSRGGMPGSKVWAKKPKVWSNIGHLKNHLSQYVQYSYSKRLITVDPTYDEAVILDVTTGQPTNDIIINNYFLEKAEKIRQKYSADDKEIWTVAKA